MERTIDTKFFDYSQNNSGGYFITNDDVREYVIVEAINAKEADQMVERITENYSSYCSCCGERWSIGWKDDDDGTDAPTIHGEEPSFFINSPNSFFKKTAVIYYYNGIKEFIGPSGTAAPGSTRIS